MLVLGRKEEQTIQIGSEIQITILRIKGNNVRVGVKAPEQMRILRGELRSTQRTWDTDSPAAFCEFEAEIASCK